MGFASSVGPLNGPEQTNGSAVDPRRVLRLAALTPVLALALWGHGAQAQPLTYTVSGTLTSIPSCVLNVFSVGDPWRISVVIEETEEDEVDPVLEVAFSRWRRALWRPNWVPRRAPPPPNSKSRTARPKPIRPPNSKSRPQPDRNPFGRRIRSRGQPDRNPFGRRIRSRGQPDRNPFGQYLLVDDWRRIRIGRRCDEGVRT